MWRGRGRRGLDDHGARLDLVVLAMPIARHGLVIRVRIKLPVRYHALRSASLGTSNPEEPSHSDQEQEESHPSSDPSDYSSETVGIG